MNNPYYCDDNTLISFSGGRTSAYMLHKVLEAHGGTLPQNVKVCFANTGKEMPETLDFVQRCADEWKVKIHWLEYAGRKPKEGTGERALYDYFYNEVNHKTASRNGEPFARVIKDNGALPNPTNRWCTGQLKIRTIRRFLSNLGWDDYYTCFTGIRADEEHRAIKMHNKKAEGQEMFCPLFVDNVTKHTVGDFWANNSFDLALPNRNGTTDYGNCDLCFLKGRKKRINIITQRPDLAAWWSRMEKEQGDVFDRMFGSYEQLIGFASSQGDMFGYDDEVSMSCFCGD